MHDVLIIGAGQTGLALSVALRQVGIYPVLLDRAPQDFEGPWATARMETLRSPRGTAGPGPRPAFAEFSRLVHRAMGQPRQALDKIPRLQWMDYLRWYRRVTQADVRNEHQVLAIRPQPDGMVEVDVQTPTQRSTWRTEPFVFLDDIPYGTTFYIRVRSNAANAVNNSQWTYTNASTEAKTGICEVIGRRIKNRDNRKLCYHSLESRCTESGGQYQRDADDGQNSARYPVI